MTLYDLRPDECGGCASGPWSGVVAFLEVLLRRHPLFRSLGIFVCRPQRGRSTGFSVHACGRAVDVDPGADSSPEGWALAHALVLVAISLGIQRIIWDGQVWDAARGWHPYTGSAGPHRDHLHIEFTAEAAAQLTMAYVTGLFGVAAPRKDPAMPVPKSTDRVAYLGLPRVPAGPGKSGGGVVALQRDGGVVTVSGRPALHGSMQSPEMRAALRGSTGIFTHLLAGPQPGEYVILDTADHAYTFTPTTLDQLAGRR